MTLPASGPIALSQVQTEFGGANPIGLSEYKGKGTNGGGNPMAMSQLRGASAGTTTGYMMVANNDGTGYVSGSGSLTPNTHRGYVIWSICYVFAQWPDTNHTFQINMDNPAYAALPKNFFDTLTIDGRTFTSASATHQFFYSLTTWSWPKPAGSTVFTAGASYPASILYTP